MATAAAAFAARANWGSEPMCRGKRWCHTSQRRSEGHWQARKLSTATMNSIRQNLFFALIYNAVSVPVEAEVLYSTFGILLSPMISAAAMALSSVSVITNALRLKNIAI